MTKPQNVLEIKFRDLGKEAERAVPGNFCIEIYFDPNSWNSGIGWNNSFFGTPDGPFKDIPGNTTLHALPENYPPFLAQQLRDLTSDAVQHRIQEADLNDETKNHYQRVESEQRQLCRELGTQSVSHAITALVVAKVLEAGEIDIDFAQETLSRELELGTNASQQLLRNAKNHLGKIGIGPPD